MSAATHSQLRAKNKTDASFKMLRSFCSVHYEPVCVLRYKVNTETTIHYFQSSSNLHWGLVYSVKAAEGLMWSCCQEHDNLTTIRVVKTHNIIYYICFFVISRHSTGTQITSPQLRKLITGTGPEEALYVQE